MFNSLIELQHSKLLKDRHQVEKGFSLVELMVVVAIIAILAALAIPQLTKFQAKSYQSEAKNNLAHVHMMQEAYYLDESTYVSFPQMVTYGGACTPAAPLYWTPGGNNSSGGQVTTSTVNCRRVRYQYSAKQYEVDADGSATAYTAAGWALKKLLPNSKVRDAYNINQDKSFNVLCDEVMYYEKRGTTVSGPCAAMGASGDAAITGAL